MKTVTCSYRM